MPQHIVANQYTLFYRTDTTAHRERLRNALPLALGALDARALEYQHELTELQRELDRKQRELTAARSGIEAWQANLKGYYTRAQELGLAEIDQDTSSWSTDRYVENLRRLVRNAPPSQAPLLKDGAVDRAAAELAQLAQQETFVSRELSRLRRRIAQMVRVKDNANEYQQQLGAQQDRLKGVSWFQERISGQKACPVCLSPSASAAQRIEQLATLTNEVQHISTSITKTPPVVDKELTELRQRAKEFEGQLNNLKKQMSALEAAQKEREPLRYTGAETFRFLGRLEQALETVSHAQPDSELGKSIAALSERMRTVKAAIDQNQVRIRTENALKRIATKISHYAERLVLERCRDHILLDLKELTLQFQSTGRSDYLFEIGSGQNWMGYHISALCALQEFFTEFEHNGVPQFLVIDQPSQVYFPEAWPTSEKDPREDVASEKKAKVSADIEGVRRVFAALSDFLERSKYQVQVIVTEHAGEITWQGIKGVHVVGNWRDGADEFLIPKEWYAL